MEKRGRFIGKIHSLRQEFGNVDHVVYMKLVSIYLSSFYGSNLWDLNGAGSQRLYATWNIMVRMTFNMPREIDTAYFSTPNLLEKKFTNNLW